MSHQVILDMAKFQDPTTRGLGPDICVHRRIDRQTGSGIFVKMAVRAQHIK